MRNRTIVILGLTCIATFIHSCKEKELDIAQTVKRGELIYEVNSQKPYTGKLFSKYENGQLASIASYHKGLFDGQRTLYYENGQISLQAEYAKGKRDGDYIAYFEDGTIKEKGAFRNDLNYGDFESHSTSGSYNTGSYDNGIPKGTFYYYDNDKLLTSTKEHLDDGGVTTTTYFVGTDSPKRIENWSKTNERRGTWMTYYENGTVKEEQHYKEDYLISEKVFSSSGQLEIEAVYPGAKIWYKNGKKVAEAEFKNASDIIENTVKRYFDNGKTFDLATLRSFVWVSQGKPDRNFSPVKGAYYLPTQRRRTFNDDGKYRESDSGKSSIIHRLWGTYHITNAYPFTIKVDSEKYGWSDATIEVENWNGTTISVVYNGDSQVWDQESR